MPTPTVLVAGIGGASLGTEIAKALAQDGGFRVLGADISPTAYGHYMDEFAATYLADPAAYVESIIALCRREDVAAIVPGGERPMALIAAARERFAEAGVALAMNDPALVLRMSDKAQCFADLGQLGFPVPRTWQIGQRDDLDAVEFPAIIKPSRESGGSSGVYFAASRAEALVHVAELLAADKQPIAQSYIPHDEGEFTVGVLSSPQGELVGSIALRRNFDNKLSVTDRGQGYLISSGYSQGLVDDFPAVREAAEAIATGLRSRGPLNVQGRVAEGVFYPFEINPRFSATTYLRTLAGFNEVGIFLRALLLAEGATAPTIVPGWYLRSFDEIFVSQDGIKL